MEYIGLQEQKRSNNVKSVLLLIAFPALILFLVYLFFYIFYNNSIERVNDSFLTSIPWVILTVGVWFSVAYFYNVSIVNRATGARPLERMENKCVYNIVENLCMANGMRMPKINIIDDDSLNAYASGINEKSYTVTFTQGILDQLNDEELAAVAAHELTHIRNNDVRLSIISIVFVGIFSLIVNALIRSFRYSSFRRSRNDKGSGLIVILVILALAAVGYFFSLVFKSAISRKREYMADAGGAEMTKNPWALASALRKISGNSNVESLTRNDVAQLFIEHPSKRNIFSRIFATHPPIDERIKILEQF